MKEFMCEQAWAYKIHGEGGNSVNFSALGMFSLLHKKKHDLGVSFIYHFLYFADVGLESDALCGVFYEFRPAKWVSLFAHASLMLKTRDIFALRELGIILPNQSVAVMLRANFYTGKYVALFLQAATYEFFRYPLFAAPIFSTGLSVSTNIGFGFDLSAKVRYIDFFTLSSGFAGAEISLGARYSF